MTTTANIDNGKINSELTKSFLDRWAKRQVLNLLSGLQNGRLVIEDSGEVFSFGVAGKSLSACLTVVHPSAYRAILFGGSIGAAESFMLGAWTSPNLVNLMRLMAANIQWLNRLDKSGAFTKRLANGIYHWLNRNSERRAQQNIAAHYDLSNDFFELFLSGDMMYSAALFPHSGATLEEASQHKLAQICEQLCLTESDHLLEIGGGWGGLAIYAAQHHGCRVTTATISRQQFEYTQQRVVEAGLQHQVEVILEDYRRLRGRYDKLVSIEMLEAVGHQYYSRYFDACCRLLKPDGLMFLQVITIPDQRYESARKSVDFIQRYIFPGGSLPGQHVIAECLAKHTDLQVVAMRDIGLHYAETLRHWRQRFLARIDAVSALGFDEVFRRMWEYYLCYCEGGFRERVIGTAQYLLAKPDWRDPRGE